MKRGVVPILLGVACLGLASARGDDEPLPSLLRPEQVGRLLYFRGPRMLTLYAPLALSSSLTCEPRVLGTDRTCILRVTNNLNGEDLAHMSILQAEHPKLQFTALPSASIEDLHEDFQKMDRDIPMSGVRPPGTLAFSADPYVSIKFDKSKRVVERLLAAYEKDGLGVFTAQFSFNGELTDDYLELVDTAPLRSVVEGSANGVKPSELKPKLEDALRAGGLASNNLTEAETVAIAYRTVLANFFKLTRESMIFPKVDHLEELPAALVLVSETRAPVRGQCRASLLLKKGAQAAISCQEVPQ